MKLIISFYILVFTFTEVGAQQMIRQVEFDGEFVITTLFDEDISVENITLKINRKAGTVTGNTGCNEYMTDFSNKDSKLRFSYIAQTKKSCPHADIEQSYFDMLIQTNSFKRIGKQLILLRDGEEIITGTSKLK